MESAQKLKELIEQASKILITSHISPDPDSISSILLLGTTLRENYPDKIIVTSSEELLDELSFLAGYDRIQKAQLLEVVANADLVIMVDAMNFERCSRKDSEAVRQIVKGKNIPLAIIDHHEPVGVEVNAIYINNRYPAAVQEVHGVLFQTLNLKKPEGWAEITMTGLYSDTGGFTYLNGKFEQTLGLISELIKAGANVERTKNKLNQFSREDLQVLGEYIKNLTLEDDYAYSFLADNFVDDWVSSGKNSVALNVGKHIFTDSFLRNIEGRKWGFIVYKNTLLPSGSYSLSLRSLAGVVNVAQIASELSGGSGGGHQPAAGATLQASNVEEAIAIVKSHVSK